MITGGRLLRCFSGFNAAMIVVAAVAIKLMTMPVLFIVARDLLVTAVSAASVGVCKIVECKQS